MFVTAFNLVDFFTNIPQALDEFRELGRIGVTQSELTVFIVLSKGIDETLLGYKESKIVATGYPLNTRLLAKRHSNR